MRVACLSFLALAAGCSTFSFRTGIVVVGGRPAFQASIEAGVSASGKRHGVSATYELGTATAERTEGYVAINADHYVAAGAGPLARVGARFRGSFSDDSWSAFELRGTAFTGLGRDRRTGSGGLGVELAGGVAVDPREPILEANLVLHRRVNLFP